MAERFIRKVEFNPAFDAHGRDPQTSCGIGSAQMKFILKKGNKAVQFMLLTGWFLPRTVKRLRGGMPDLQQPLPADLGYHSPVPMYEGQPVMDKNCEYIGCPCYYDGSSLNAMKPYQILVAEGGESLWGYLEGYWYLVFGEMA